MFNIITDISMIFLFVISKNVEMSLSCFLLKYFLYRIVIIVIYFTLEETFNETVVFSKLHVLSW